MQATRVVRRELEAARERRFSIQKKIICNWSLLKKSLTHRELLDSLISNELVPADLWDDIKKESQGSQMDTILRNVLKNIETSDDYDKFKVIVTTLEIELQSPSDELTIPTNRRAEDHLRANRELIEKELYPKDQIDNFLEWFILSPEDHEGLRNKENVRQQMAKLFLDKIMKPTKVDTGSITRLMICFQGDTNCILEHLSKLMDSDLPNGISHFIDDKDLHALIEKRNDYRKNMLSKWTYLKENFYPYSILIDELHDNGLVDKDRAEIIYEKPRREQVYLTLRNIIRRIDKPAMFSKLITILKRENKFIADKLLEMSIQTDISGAREYDFRDLSVSYVRAVRAKLEYYKDDIVREFYPSDVDTFLENFVFDIDDHELIFETGNDEIEKAWCFYEKISDKNYIEKGSLDCLVSCLISNEKLKIRRQKLAELLLSPKEPEKVINRTKIATKATNETFYQRNISTFTKGELKLTVDDTESKETLENEIFAVAESFKREEIDGFKLKVKHTKRSSVVVHLEPDGGNVQFIVEKGIVNGDLDTFIRNLLDDENIKIHMTPEKKYNMSVSLHTKNNQRELDSVSFTLKGEQVEPKLRIIKANRELLEEEYDPMPFLKSVFEDNVKQYKSVTRLSPEYMADFKHQFREINKVPERRKRVKQFLDIAEDMIEADTLWELLEETANAFSVKKMKDDLYYGNSGRKYIRYSDLRSAEGLVFEGKYEVWITEEDVKSPLQSMIIEERQKKDVKSPLQSMIIEERQKKDNDKRLFQDLEETDRRKRIREDGLNNDVKLWKRIRTETLPRLDELKDELREANEKIRKAISIRNCVFGFTLFSSLIGSVFSGGMSLVGGIGVAAATGGAAGITLLIERYVEKDVLSRTQQGINKDKEATYQLITRVRAYRGTHNVPFAEKLHRIKLEGIDDLAKDPLDTFISSLVDVENASLLKAADKIIELRLILEDELQEVERIQGQHSFS